MESEEKQENQDYKGKDKDENKDKKSFLDRFVWQDYLFAIMLVIFLVLNVSLIAPLKSLPSPIYGGDYYYHLGYVNHLIRGGSVFENSQYSGQTPWAPFLYQGSIALFSRITSADPMKANIYLSLVFLIISMMIIYYFCSKFFRNKLAGILASAFYAAIFPIFKYQQFTDVITMPLFFFMVWLAFEKKSWLLYILAGISYGLVGISHTFAFVSATVFLAVLLAYLFIFQHFSRKHSRRSESSNDHNSGKHKKKLAFSIPGFKEFFVKNWKFFLIMIIIGVAIAMLYWAQPIFKFHLKTPNNIAEYNGLDIASIGLVKNTFKSIIEEFFTFGFGSTSEIYYSLLFFATIIGLILIIFAKNRPFSYKYLFIILIAFIIARFHYIITLPLFRTEYFSGLVSEWFMIFLHCMLLIVTIIGLLSFVKSQKIRTGIFIAAIMLVAVLASVARSQLLTSDKFFASGKTELPPYLVDVSEWVNSNTGITDVFLSTNEISFMLNSVTGNKMMASRRSHSGMWVDVDSKWADAAIVLYGNNTEQMKKLLKQHNVKYLYWQYNWIELDYQFNEKNQLVGWFDPLLIRDIDNYEQYLSENGVNFTKIKTWLDPAARRPDIKQFNMMMVWPSQWNDEYPWSKAFNDTLRIKKEFYQNGALAARIYEINTE